MKGICFWKSVLLLVFLLIPHTLLAQDEYAVTLQANQSAIEVIGEAGFEMPPSTFYLGGNLLYDEDEYGMIGFHAMVGNAIQADALTGKIGFKGVAGDFERPGPDSRLLGLTFSVAGEYDLSDAVATYYVPVILFATLNFGPEPLCFDDTEDYIEVVAGADWKILENGAITASYRYLEVGFEGRDKWQKVDTAAYVGFKFFF